MLDLTVLQSFVAVVRTASVAEAARRTGYSHAAVSRHIAAVEAWAGLELFQRTARSVRPSVAARILADRAELLIDEAQQFENDARSLSRGVSGELRVGYFRAAGTTIVPPALARFSHKRPSAGVTLTEYALTEEVSDALLTGDLDVGFVWGYPEVGVAGLQLTPLFDEALVLMTSIGREELHEDARDLSRLVGEPFVSAVGHKGAPPIIDQMFITEGLPAPIVAHRSPDHAMTRSLVAAGLAVSLLPALGVSDPYPGVRRSIARDGFRRTWLARPEDARNRLAGAFVDAACGAAAEYSGFGVTPVRSASRR